MDNGCYYVYILASYKNGTLYVGFTHDLTARVWAHKQDVVKGFTNKYQVHKLVYYQAYEDRQEALKMEKRLKRWHRKWKLLLIEKNNPDWKDLYDFFSKG